MKLFRRDPFGHVLFLKRLVIQTMGLLTWHRFQAVNTLKVEGCEHLEGLPQSGVLFVSNHQTYYADVICFYHIFSALKWGVKNRLPPPYYLFNPRVNSYYLAAEETMMKSGLLPKVLAYAGAVTVKRSWREQGQNVQRGVDLDAVSAVGTALADGWLVSFPQGTTRPAAPLRKGTAFLIKDYKPIVVPIRIDGFRRAFDKKGFFFKKRGTTLSVAFRPPLDVDYDAEPEALLEQVKAAILTPESAKSPEEEDK